VSVKFYSLACLAWMAFFYGVDVSAGIPSGNIYAYPLGVASPISVEDHAVVVLIHGWNPDGTPNPFSEDAWVQLCDLLHGSLGSNSAWRLLQYNWASDASTGSVGLYPPINGASPDVSVFFGAGFYNASSAAANAHANGTRIADLLIQGAPKLKKIIFIAHSAGSWAARRAIERILEINPDVVVSLVLLDPFVPGMPVSNQSTILNSQLMSSLRSHVSQNRIVSLENYYSIDITDKDFVFGDAVGNKATSQIFDWRDSDESGLRVNQNYYYDGHSGPIKFYADTVKDSEPFYQFVFNQLPELGNLPVRSNDLGWYRSMFMQEPIVEAIEIRGGDENQVCALLAAPKSITTRREKLRDGTATGFSGYRWQRRAADGSWQNLSDSPDYTHIVGSGSNVLTFNQLRLSDAGWYRLSLSRQVTDGGMLSNESAPVQLTVRPAASTGGVAPPAPSGLAATAVSSSQINLVWTDNASTESGFRIERKQNEGAWSEIASPTANTTTFSDKGLSASATYSYQIRAHNAAGFSSYSNTASAKTQGALATTRTLTIQSSSPASGAVIYVTTDKNGQGEATTPATRSYNANQNVALIASPTAGGNSFQKWQRDGTDLPGTSTVTYVAMDASYTITAVYGAAGSTRTLTGVNINGAASVSENTSQTYTATATFSDGSSATVSPSWGLAQNGAPASISANGVLDAGAVNADTAVTVQVSYISGGVTRTATKSVTIINADSAQSYELGLSVGAHGEVVRTPNQNWFPAGTQVTLRAISETNYRFTGWGGSAASHGTTNPITVTMDGNKSITASFVYDNMYFGPVTVTLQPAGAVSAGAQWRLGNGPWQSSGATVSPDSNGDHNLFFSSIPGYIAPPTQPIVIVSGQANPFTATYISQLSAGSLQVMLQPEGAVTAGAQWRPTGDGFEWQASGATLSGLAAGVYQLEFKPTTGWTLPSAQSVAVNDGRATSASTTYGPPAGVPALYSIVPANGPMSGGTVVTLDGANLTQPVAVYFDDTPATSVTLNGATQVTVVAPPRATGGTVSVRMTTASGEVTKTNGFTYGPMLGKGMQLELSLGGSVTAVDVLESRAYINQGPTLIVFDVSNPANPTPMGRFTVPYAINDVAVYRGADNHVYAALAGSVGGLLLVDVTNPGEMALKSSLVTGGEARDIALLGGMAYMGDGYNGLAIIDLTNPATPALRGTVSGIGYAANVFVEANSNGVTTYVADAAGNRIHFIDVSESAAPVIRGAFVHGYGWTDGIHGMAKKGNILYFNLQQAVILIDVTDLAAPVLVRNLAGSANSGSAAFIKGNILYSVRRDVGVDILDITSPNAPVRLVNYAPASVNGWVQRAALQGSYLYIAGSDSGFTIIDVSNPGSPAISANYRQGTEYVRTVVVSAAQAAVYAGNSGDVNVYSMDTLATARFLAKFVSMNGGSDGLAQNGNLLFSTEGGNGIYVLDVTTPSAPVVRGMFNSAIPYGDIGIHSGRLVMVGQNISNYSWGLWVVDVSNPASPSTYGATSVASSIWNVAVSGNKAVAASASDGGLQVFDLSDPRNPRAVGNLATSGFALSVAISADGQTAYIAEGNPSGSNQGGFLVVDVSNAASPTLVSNILTGKYVRHVSVSGQRLVVSRGTDGVTVYDISNPRSPVEMAGFDTPGSALQACIEGERVYVADGYQGVALLTLLDAIPPEVTITNPVFGNAYTTTGSNIALGGAASDDKALARMVWSNDRGGAGEVVGLENWTVSGIPLLPGPNVIKVTAFDLTGNMGSDTLTVSYEPSDSMAPTLSIVSPSINETAFVAAGTVTLSGIAHDNLSLAQITWTNSRGGGGTATGKEQWNVTNVVLAEGPNRITVTAQDTAGNAASTIITITYTPADVTAPVTAITFPTINAAYPTNAGSLNLAGTASDDRGIIKVRWTNDRGGEGAVAGAPIWSINGITLHPGMNVITVVAEDGAGNSSGDTLVINYDSTLKFDMHPLNEAVFAGDTVMFTAVTNDAAADIQWQVSTDGRNTWMNLVEGDSISGTTAGTLTIVDVPVGLAGNYYRAVANNSVASASSDFAALTVLASFAGWRVEQFSSDELADITISGPTADPDGDGFANIVEYALGLSAKSADHSGLPEVITSATDWIYTYVKPTDRLDLSYIVETSTDLETWTTSGVTTAQISSINDRETWQARVSLSTTTNVFFRLKVTQL